MEDKPLKVKKIDPTILKACKKNKVTKFSQIATLHDYIINPKTKGNIKQSYMLNHDCNELTAEARGSQMVGNSKIEKTIQDILIDNDLSKNNIIKDHKLYRDSAFQAKDYSNAIKANQDFMKISGVLKEHTQEQGNTFIFNDSAVDFNNIDKFLKI